ncbi:MmgE/PrpD family protein [Rhodoligotrophos defluvii]|uniref:MmgE/PrpD family protein n=1 Tax=Rhodoligotrophos defluvii TaxID=2561934 RepID=UPI0010C9FD1F|nr:MmgE/PrpD family protein [Rhodoligotrophos defluvii]
MDNGANNLPLTSLLAATCFEAPNTVERAAIDELAKQCVLDWIGVSLAAIKEPAPKLLRDEFLKEGVGEEASIVGHPRKAHAATAAMLNAALSHALDYDDVNLAMPGHASVPVLSTVLALAEKRGASGSDLLDAFVVGYEAVCRLAQLVAPGHYARGFQATATVGCLGAAVGGAYIQRLDHAHTLTALSIAASQAAGMKSVFGSMSKILQVARAAQNAVVAVNLARRGLTGRSDILECSQGFAATHSPDFNPEAALQNPRGGLHLFDNLFKYHAACFETHSTIDSVLMLIRDGLSPDEVERMVVRVNPACDKICNIQSPRTGMEGKFSFRLLAAFAALGIDTSSPESYTDENVNRSDVVELRDRIRVEFDERFPLTFAQVTAFTRGGRELSARSDCGMPETDVMQQGERVISKFHMLVEPILGPARTREIVSCVGRLERLGEVRELCATFSGTSAAVW